MLSTSEVTGNSFDFRGKAACRVCSAWAANNTCYFNLFGIVTFNLWLHVNKLLTYLLTYFSVFLFLFSPAFYFEYLPTKTSPTIIVG